MAGSVVASIRVAAPTVSPFLVHATIPLPPKTYLGSGPTAPLALLDTHGNPVDTQVEVVARYPKASDGASVVEIIGRLDAPVGQSAPLDLFVQLLDSPQLPTPVAPTIADFIAAPKQLPGPVKSLLSFPGQVLLGARDAFGNIYLLDLVHDKAFDQGARRTQRFGSVQAEFRNAGLMRPLVPTSGPQATLSHLFGVHAYFRITAGDPVVELDLRIHNGPDGKTTQNEAQGDLYFDELVLLVPQGWVAAQRFSSPSLGKAYNFGPYVALPLVDLSPDGKLHVMPQQAQMERRIVLTPGLEIERGLAHLNHEGLGFASAGPLPGKQPVLWSWWNPATPHYFPQGHVLPRLAQTPMASIEAELTADYNYLYDHLKNGTGAGIYPIISDELGWAHPYGAAYGGMTGGDGIEFFWGLKTLVAASVDGYRHLEVLHRMDTDRMANALFRLDGTPSKLEDWVIFPTTGPAYVPFYFYMQPSGSNDPFGYKSAPTFQSDYVHSQGLEPSYEAALLGYEIIDLQHLVRYTGPAKALAWIGNDSMAKDDLELQAEMMHLSYHMYENSAYNNIQETGMLADRQYIDAHPGVGFPFGRGEGWGLDTMNAAYVLGSDDFRQRKLGWFQDITELIADGQSSCTGFIQSTVYNKLLEGKYRVRQVIESSIVQNAMLGTLNNVFMGVDPLHEAQLADSLRLSLFAMIRPEAWDPSLSAPYSQLAVAPLDSSLPPFCGQPPAGGQSLDTDAYQQWSSLAYGLELTGDPAFLAYAELMLGMPLTNLVLDKSLDNIGNRAALNAVVELIIESL